MTIGTELKCERRSEGRKEESLFSLSFYFFGKVVRCGGTACSGRATASGRRRQRRGVNLTTDHAARRRQSKQLVGRGMRYLMEFIVSGDTVHFHVCYVLIRISYWSYNVCHGDFF